MAATFSYALDVHFAVSQSDPKRPIFFTKRLKHQNPSQRFCISCKTSKSSSSSSKPQQNPLEEQSPKKTQSLSEQLQPLSTTTLPKKDQAARLSSNPKSTWVNPSKPKRSVLSLQRQKRSPHAYNPQLRELKLFAKKLNDCENNEGAFLSVLEQFPHQPNRENSLLILNSLKPWQKAYYFFNWLKTNNFFPMETIFYNVMMKYLRLGGQFEVIEELANEMVSNEIPLDNITYSTIISCARRCYHFDKAVEWFERMYRTGLMPDEVTYSAILDVYAKLGKVEEVISLYERGVASSWKPDMVTFSVLAKMFGVAGDYEGIKYVLQEMKSVEVKPNLVVYNTLIEAMGRAGKPGFARNLFEDLIESGLSPNEKTLTAIAKIYGKARWEKDALKLWEEMKSKNWPVDFILYNTLLTMFADIGLVEEAEQLFIDMKRSENFKPDSWSYTAMLNIYASGGNVDKAMELFEEMFEVGVELNVMGTTCLIQCLGKTRRIDELVRAFTVSIQQEIEPDDRLCGCLLSVVSLCDNREDIDKVLACLHQANPRLVEFVELIEDEKSSLDTIKEEFRHVLSDTKDDARRPFCNCLIDICRSKNLHERAHDLLYLGTLYGLYPRLHNKTADEWSLNVRTLSVGAAKTALEEWMGTLAKIVKRGEALPELFSAQTGTGTHKFAQGLSNSFGSHLKELGAPFKNSEDKVGCFVATREDLLLWLQSKIPSSSTVIS
ncbi:hypothetical protein Godav_026330 [Gossypium davidsonii]|uniref:Smr domain-containing protein n=1 Tax=Gossypium davidsonii TaxID=34287 RepID=A0A7J8RTE0_GOSDV|nr:hypothetical protein [Gossypium davidsonii]